MRVALPFALLLIAGACDETPATQVLVRIDAGMARRAQTDRVRVQVSGAASPGYDETARVGIDGTFPFTVPVIPKGGDATRTFTIAVELLDEGGGVIARETRDDEGFVENVARELTIFFPDEATGDGGVDGGTPDAAVSDGGACDCPCASDTCDPIGACVPARRIELVATGETHACAIDEAGALFCWGANDRGQLGIAEDDLTPRPMPTQVTGAGPFRSVSLGQQWTNAVERDGDAFSWGSDEARRLGIGPFGSTGGDQEAPYPMATTDQLGAHVAGTRHGCAVSETDVGRLRCWGHNGFLQVGVEGMGSYASPVGVGFERSWLDVAAGEAHTCSLRNSGELFCWGRALFGRLGNGDTSDTSTTSPQRVPGAYAAVDAGARHTCGVRTDGTLHCWGFNATQQLGVTGPDRGAPVQVGDATDWEKVDAGETHTCAIASGGRLECWGANLTGQLGVAGLGPAESLPVVVGTGWATVGAGNGFTCGTRDDGTLHCWGSDAGGRLGLGGAGDRDAPARVCVP